MPGAALEPPDFGMAPHPAASYQAGEACHQQPVHKHTA
jgi:hypothetical protein